MNRIIDWKEFNVDIYSTEYTGKKVLTEVVQIYPEEQVDLRPYIIENPLTINIYVKFERILDLFRTMHLRHLPVVNPADGSIQGIITRKDIFAYMSL